MTRTLRLFILTVALAGLAAAGAACVAPEPAPAPTQAPAVPSPIVLPAPALPAATSTPAPAPPAASSTSVADTTTPAGAATAAATEVPLGGPAAGALTSYNAAIEYKEEVIQPAPTSVQNWVTMTVKYQGQPAPGIYALNVVDKAGSLAPSGSETMQVIVAGQDSYVMSAEQGGKWLKMPVDQSGAASIFSNLLDPNNLRQDTPRAVFSAANTVNAHEQVAGEDTTHYRAKDSALAGLLSNEMGDSKLVSGQADFWISNQGGYLKQYQLDAVVSTADNRRLHELGKLLVSATNQPANIATPAPDQVLSSDIFNQPAVNAPGTTALPSGSYTSQAGQAALRAVPAPPLARVVSNGELSAAVRTALQTYVTPDLPGTLYLSTAKADDLLSFYRTQLAKQGWEEVDIQSGSTLAQPALGTFGRDTLTLTLTILPDAGKRGNAVYVQVEG